MASRKRVAQFDPQLIAAFVYAVRYDGLGPLAVPYNAGVKLRLNLNELRVAMREEAHMLAHQIEHFQITLTKEDPETGKALFSIRPGEPEAISDILEEAGVTTDLLDELGLHDIGTKMVADAAEKEPLVAEPGADRDFMAMMAPRREEDDPEPDAEDSIMEQKEHKK